MRKRLVAVLAVLAVIVFAGAIPVWAQEARATLGGRVTDAQAAIVPNAEVVVTSDDTSVKQHTKTNEQGNWSVRFLLPGRYSFSVSAAGFKQAERRGVELQTSDIKQIDTQLELGPTTQAVEVTAEAPLVDTTSATSGTVITRQEITEIPSQSHVVTLLALLSPGVVEQDQNNNVVHMWSYLGSSQITADGGRNNTYSNTFQLDGMPNVRGGGNISFIPSMDAVQEFRVQTNAYDASIGRQAGATVSLTTRSGGKDYHGTLYEFNQNNMLNANLFQTNLVGGVVPPIHFNEFGGTIGGPVWIPKLYRGKAKTFFFFSYDNTHNIGPRPGSTRSVPTALERTGDFSQSFTTQLIGGQLQRFPIQVFDPLTVDSAGNRTLFPGMVIPKSRLSSSAQSILGYVPLPNTAGDPTGNATNNFVSSATRSATFPVVSVRLDQNWNDYHHSFATVRWAHLDENFDNYFHNAATGQYHVRVPRGIGLDHVWTLSPNKILDLRFNVNRYEEPTVDNGVGFDPTKLGFSPSLLGLLQKPSFPRITGFAGDFGAATDSYSNSTYYTWSLGFTHVHGNHTLRYGAEFWAQQDAGGNLGAQPQYDFNGNWTRQSAIVGGGTGVGSTLASYLLGLPSGGNLPVNANSMYSQHYLAFFFQDDWRVTPKLTVNLGLRWDYERPVQERYNRLVDRFDPTVINPVTPSAQAAYATILADPANASNPGVQLLSQLLPAGAFKVPGSLLFAGLNGTPRGAVNPDYHEWQPRAGFAYQITPATVIRGGFGRFVQADFVTGGQAGFGRTTSLIATQDNFFTPYDTLSNPFRGGVLFPTGSSLGALTNLGSGIGNWDNPNLGRFYSWEYSAHLQHQFKGWLVEVGYSHNKTYNISWAWNENLPALSQWQKYLAPQFDSTGRPLDTLAWNTLVPNPFYQLPNVTGGSIGSSKTIVLNQLLNPIPLLAVTNKNNPTGKNQYDAGLVKIEHRFTRGFSIIGALTYSKLFEDTAFLGAQIIGPVVEHKLGGEDRPFHLNVAPIWEVPVGRGKKFGSGMSRLVDAVVGGWEFTGTLTLQSGVPVAFGTDSFFTGKNFALPRGRQSLAQWFDTTQFAPFPNKNSDISTYPAWTGVQNLPGANYKPAAGDTIRNGVYQDFANYVRTYPTRWSIVRASRVNNVDMGLYKNVRFNERMKLQLRFDAFNAFNHPRFGAPDTNPGNSTFGRVTGSEQNQARAVELGARLSF